MSRIKSRISVIIPVYNEESRLADCLRAVTRQTIKPKEIIVVDNNSTDQSVVIAKTFKGVKIIKEPRQGMIPARDAGFNKATGEILARIDADTLLPKDWVQKVENYFKLYPHLSGITGYGQARVGIKNRFAGDFISRFYFLDCKAYFGTEVLWGANMAIKKEAWDGVKNLVHTGEYILEIHEDQDLSLALISTGRKIGIFKDLRVSVDFGSAQEFDKFWRYYKMRQNSKRLHQKHERSKSPAIKLIPMYKRASYKLITTPLLASYFVFSLGNTARKILVSDSLKHSIVWVYKRLY